MYRLMNICVDVLSLVTKGANKKKIIFKSQDPPENPTLTRFIPISKTDEDQRMVYGIVYSPDEVDTDGHTASAEEIKKASENFMKSGRTTSVDKQHNYNTDEGFVAENWITKQGDPLFPDDPVGSWAVGIKVEKEDTWQLVKSGEISGISLAGMAELEEIGKQDKSDHAILKWLKTKLGKEFQPNVSPDIVGQMLDVFQANAREIFKEDYSGDRKSAVLYSVEQMKTWADTNITRSDADVDGLKYLINFENSMQEEDMTKEEILKSLSEDVNIQKLSDQNFDSIKRYFPLY